MSRLQRVLEACAVACGLTDRPVAAVRWTSRTLTLLCGLVLAGPADLAWGQCQANEFAKLTASDAASPDEFGRSVSISGNVAVIGADSDSDAGFQSGSAYVYRFDGTAWIEEAKLTASDGAAGDRFGRSVSISTDVAVIGAFADEDAGFQSGSAYVYRFDGANWIEEAKLTASDAAVNHWFGRSVSISNDVAVIGAIFDDDACPGEPFCDSGSAYVYRFNGKAWIEEDKLTASDAAAGDYFGGSVSISGDSAVIGAFRDDDACPGDPNCDSGSAYVYRFDGANWIEEAKLTASDAALFDLFGLSVSISGDVALIGAFKDDDACPGDPSCNSGSAYVYRFNGTNWIEEFKLTASDAASLDEFGVSVSVNGDLAVIGAWKDGTTGSAYVYRFDGSMWNKEIKLTASDAAGGDSFGASVSISGDVAVIGAVHDDDAGPFSGSAYAFRGWLADCNGNGILNICDIANGTSQDANGNGVPDECDEFLWIAPFGGAFDAPENWEGGFAPRPLDTTVFDGIEGPDPPAYPVIFLNSAETDRLVVRSPRDVRFLISGVDYQVNGNVFPGEPSIVVGELPGLDARLKIENVGAGPELHGVVGSTISIADGASSIGTLTATEPFTQLLSADLFVGREGNGSFVVENGASADASGIISIGTLPDAVGDVQLTGAGTLWTTTGSAFYVGESGQGSLTITGGAQLLSATFGPVVLAKDPGSTADVIVSGQGSAWIEQFAFLFAAGDGTVTITLSDGGSIDFPLMGLSSQGILRGDGSVVAEVVSVGEIRPGSGAAPASSGVLTVTGPYRQIGIPAGGGAEDSGTLSIDLGGTMPGTEHDQLVITGGSAELGGGLFVELINAFDPQVGQTFNILNATTIINTFDVAFMPGLPDGKFMRLAYGPGAALGPGSNATIVVENLESLFDFNGTSESIDGQPSAVAAGDFDGDGDDDVAIVLLGPTKFDNGSLLVLRSGGFDPRTGQWLIEGMPTQTTVGVNPSGITVGLFDADTDLDIAVTNAGDNNVSVLINSGLGDGSFDPPVNFPVGNQPSDVAAAEFNGDDFVDLVVANAGDKNLQFLYNDGTAGFTTGAIVETGFSPLAVDPSDIDGNKDEDAVSANQGSNNVSVVINQGFGNFAPAVNIDVGVSPVDVAVSDFDGNGFDDFVTANNGDGTVSVVVNNGDGTFAPAVHLPVGDLPRSLTAIDLEGDTDDDIAVVANNDLGVAVVQVLRNDLTDGQLIFADAEELEAGIPAFVTTGDLDNDAQEDLITVGGAGEAGGAGLPGPTNAVNVQHNISDVAPCPWDCGGDNDGAVGIVDFLALLAQWGQVGTSCDFNGNGVGIVEFLELLANWGPCPEAP